MQMSPAWSGFMLWGKGRDKDAKEILPRPSPPPCPIHHSRPARVLKDLKKKMKVLGPHSPPEVHRGAGE